jgi:perosamine synthetase
VRRAGSTPSQVNAQGTQWKHELEARVADVRAGDYAIALSRPEISKEDIEAACRGLRPEQIAYGPEVDGFESAISELLGGWPTVAVASGTAALHLALLAAGVGPGDEVIVPTLTFVAPANAVRYVGALPLFFDAEAHYRQLDVDRLAQWLSEEAEHRHIKAVVAVDLLGHPTDLRALREVVAPYGIKVIDDASEALGAELRGRPVGTLADKRGPLADFACLSFNANKIVTCGGGGMVVCKDEGAAALVRSLATQAKAEDQQGRWVHDKVAYNYRLSSPAAALGHSQLRRLDEFVARKRELAAFYTRALGDIAGIATPREAEWASSTFWLYAIDVNPDEFGMTAVELSASLKALSIASRRIFTPMHTVGVHEGAPAMPCPVAERIGERGLILPSSAGISEAEREQVVDGVRTARPS